MNEIMCMELPSYLAGSAYAGGEWIEVTNPWNGERAGRVATIDGKLLDRAIADQLSGRERLSRYRRSEILRRAGEMLGARREEFARLITRESGLCVRETRYEVSRACDVFHFASMEALRDDGQCFSCDISATGKERKIFTLREPVSLVAAITPFNHPLNQVAHKLAPAIAAGAPMVLKPSEKTPLTAVRLAEVLYEAGLPGWMLSVVHGDLEEVTKALIRDERVELVSFTGSARVGKEIAGTAGYKKLCLELGGHSPVLVLEDADLDLAARLACEGAFRNSGQRCTAARRLLVDEKVIGPFTEKLVALAKTYRCGDPEDEETVVGTVIDEAAAMQIEAAVRDAVEKGAKRLLGGGRKGAVMEPTVLAGVPRSAWIAGNECFGPLAPIYPIKGLEDGIAFANATSYGLSSAVVTRSMDAAIRVVKELDAGTVNVNEVPGYRLELSPFGGVKDSGLGIKEGVVEAMKFMSRVKTFSLPW